MDFLERIIKIEGGQLATYSAGQGLPLLFLHGGPGDSHHYLLKVAKPLTDSFQCILYDQRGCGKSRLEELSYETLAIEEQLQDILRVRQAYNLEKLILVGHSWGACLALFFAAHFPQYVEKVALLNLGPLDEAMSKVANANLMHVLLPKEREEWQRLRRERQSAMVNGDEARFSLIEEALMKLRVRAWLFKPELHDPFLADYQQDSQLNRAINFAVNRDARRFFRWQDLDKVRARLFIGQGQQDYIPWQQALLLRERLGGVEIRLWNECAHLPWYDQPELFFWDLRGFLTSA